MSDPRFGSRMRGLGPYWQGVETLLATTARRLGLSTREDRETSANPRANQEKPDAATLVDDGPPAANSSGIVQLPLFQ